MSFRDPDAYGALGDPNEEEQKNGPTGRNVSRGRRKSRHASTILYRTERVGRFFPVPIPWNVRLMRSPRLLPSDGLGH